MKIKKIERYLFLNQEYRTLIGVQNAVHDEIGEKVIDTMKAKGISFVKASHENELLKHLCEPETRKILLKMLNVTFEQQKDFEGNAETVNVLDIT